MKVLRSWRLAACAVLVSGVAGTAGAVPAQAQARVTAAVSQSQVVASWGMNGSGELGDGTTTDRSRYGDIGALGNVVRVAAGWTPRYGHTLAVRSDGTVWAWGDNTHGDLGDGTTDGRLAPVQVTGLTGVTQVAGGCDHSLALRSDGTVWAWGGNGAGQLGRGTVTGYEVAPAPVSGLAGVTKIAAGCGFSLALRSDGTVWAWGYDNVGQLGTGTTTPVTGPVQVTGLTGATQVAAGTAAGFAIHIVPLTAVPDLTGDTQARAGQVLQAAGLVLGAVTTVTDKYCDHLGVMSQNPPAGTAVFPGTAVSVTIGQAPANGCP